MKYLYLVSCQQYSKIGIANDVSSRIAQLTTGNPFPIKVLAVYGFENAGCVELSLHQRFANKRSSGEWFDLDIEDIASFNDICLALGGERVVIRSPDSYDIEESEIIQDAIEEEKWDFGSMFSDGWRMEILNQNGSPRNWIWRRGSGADRRSIYGGTIDTLPFPIVEMRERYGNKK